MDPPAAAAAVMPSMDDGDMAAIEEILGYSFTDKKLAAEALTLASFYTPHGPGPSYDRLEFLGDSVLGCVVARQLYTAYPSLPQGPLTKLRSANVDEEKLARVAASRGLHRFLRHQSPVLEQQIQDFMADMRQYPIHSKGLLDAPKVLSDIVESLLGAIFIDSKYDLEEVWKVFRRLADPLISAETLGQNPVSELQELCQKTRRGVKIMSDDWDKNLTVDVLVDGELVGSATYVNKKEIAKNRAAKAALDRLKETLAEASQADM